MAELDFDYAQPTMTALFPSLLDRAVKAQLA